MIWLANRRAKTPPVPEETNAMERVAPQNDATESSLPTATPSLPRSTKGAIGSLKQIPAPIAVAGSKEEQTLTILSNYNDTPIVFYGKLEDQFGKPVVNAAVDFSIQFNNGREEGTKRGRVMSDANGLFTISGYKGENLSAAPKKDGYALASLSGHGIILKRILMKKECTQTQAVPFLSRCGNSKALSLLLGSTKHTGSLTPRHRRALISWAAKGSLKVVM
jgi:hypothetical protein